jgi:hypothetical protein
MPPMGSRIYARLVRTAFLHAGEHRYLPGRRQMVNANVKQDVLPFVMVCIIKQ